MRRVPLFWPWVENEAALINTDGCSKVTGAYRKHCKVHDLAYYYAKDPKDAYHWYVEEGADCWAKAKPITKAQADANFRRGIQADSAFGFFSLMAAIRWLGVKIGGGGAWEAHRARERQEQGAGVLR